MIFFWRNVWNQKHCARERVQDARRDTQPANHRPPPPYPCQVLSHWGHWVIWSVGQSAAQSLGSGVLLSVGWLVGWSVVRDSVVGVVGSFGVVGRPVLWSWCHLLVCCQVLQYLSLLGPLSGSSGGSIRQLPIVGGLSEPPSPSFSIEISCLSDRQLSPMFEWFSFMVVSFCLFFRFSLVKKQIILRYTIQIFFEKVILIWETISKITNKLISHSSIYKQKNNYKW